GLPLPDNGWLVRFGSDTLKGGDGNDYLVGDIVDIEGLREFLETNQLNLDGNPIVNLNRIRFGNDILEGGEDEDTFATMLFGSSGGLTVDLLLSQCVGTFTDFSLVENTHALTIFDPENMLGLESDMDDNATNLATLNL